ncbi:uncharacterized protein E6C27_scaffold24G002670 [Cucumis melo var. makuwa]|uniref:Transmembrane protein n=1 Tax=Cucumis melo var. makuwa TaxID=1194695 RepID=A0A5A7UHN9_CUCMM|nr:uncharacterized protein E6C27_scaffold24G002670 [Cucumis melo var. makuwa]
MRYAEIKGLRNFDCKLDFSCWVEEEGRKFMDGRSGYFLFYQDLMLSSSFSIVYIVVLVFRVVRMYSKGTGWFLQSGLLLHQSQPPGLVSFLVASSSIFVFDYRCTVKESISIRDRYTLRHYHDIQVDRRLESIEEAMRTRHQLEHSELTKVVNAGKISVPACFATAGTSLIIGYCLGWRGGKQYANKQFRREQMKLLGEIKPRWSLLTRLKPKELIFPFRRSSGKAGMQESGSQIRNKTLKDAAAQEH